MNGAGKSSAPDLELVRTSVRDDGAFGVLQALKLPPGSDGIPIAVCCEHTYALPDASGAQVLKIPAGRHRCVRTEFHGGRPKPYATFEILVEGHSRALFHRANVEDELYGCVGVGRRFGLLNGKPAVLDSFQGFAEFMKWAGSRPEFDLLVRGAA